MKLSFCTGKKILYSRKILSFKFYFYYFKKFILEIENKFIQEYHEFKKVLYIIIRFQMSSNIEKFFFSIVNGETLS